jgi:exonuclease III
MTTLKLASLNINGITSTTRHAMLEAYVRLHDLDVVPLQEVTRPLTIGLHGYNIQYNIGTTRRGTTIITRDTITVTNPVRIPSGCAVAVSLGALTIINVYAPSGSAKRQEREAFFNNDLFTY